MRRLIPPAAAGVLLLLVFCLGAPSQAASGGTQAPGPALVSIIQALPGAVIDVTLDGKSVASGSEVGDILGPFELAAGSHDVGFTSADGVAVSSTLNVKTGQSTDVVLHLPAEVGGSPVVHSYHPATGDIGPGKARVLLAHTATVAPADVELNGEIVFTNIANGEFAEADIPAGTHEVALLPAASSAEAILGPLDVTLEARTLSMIYAYGNPRDGSMNVIAHTTTLEPDGSVAPTRIDTGSAGLVQAPVDSFGVGEASRWPWPAVLLLLAGCGGMVLVVTGRRTRPRPPNPTA